MVVNLVLWEMLVLVEVILILALWDVDALDTQEEGLVEGDAIKEKTEGPSVRIVSSILFR